MIRGFLYPAPAIAVPSPPPAPLVEETLRLGDGTRVCAWRLEAPGSGAAPGDSRERASLVFFHGNGENLETMRRGGLFEALAATGRFVLAIDYPGYGRSAGRPSEDAIAEASRAAWRRLAELHPDGPRAIVGWSLGAAAAVALAAEAPDADRLVLLSPWMSLQQVAKVHFPGLLVDWLVGERWDSAAAAERVEIPTLIVHGALDSIIPATQGEELAGRLAGPSRYFEVPRAGHNDLLAEASVWRALAAFLGPGGGAGTGGACAVPVQ